jgi:hypothetical protein
MPSNIKPPIIKAVVGSEAAASATSVRQAIAILSRKLGFTGNPTFAGLTLTGLTDDSIVFIDNNGVLSENNTNLNWNNDNNILTIGSTIQIKDSDGNIVMFSDDTQFYVTSSAVIPIEAGMSMGLLLAITYAGP